MNWKTALVVVLFAAAAARGQTGAGLNLLDIADLTSDGKYLRATVVPSRSQVTGGSEFHLAVDMTVADKWYYYSPDPGGAEGFSPIPGRIDVSAGELEAGAVLWPPDVPQEYTVAGTTYVNHVYTGRTIVYVPIGVPIGARKGRHTITLTVHGGVCKQACVELRGIVRRAAVIVGDRAVVNPAWRADSAYADGLGRAVPAERLRELRRTAAVARPAAVVASGAENWTAAVGLPLALLAGLILNIMPCVLPVIPLRIVSIVQMAGESRRRFATLAMAFCAGIVLFFVGVAVANIVLRLAFDQAFDWSRHYQSAGVRIGLAMVVVALAANLFGLFNVTVPRRIASLEGAGSRRQGHLASLGMGVMMAVLATPCSFALLAAALTWAQVQPLWLGTVAIVLIGAGMAAPHLVLAAFPNLVTRLPRPGRWMEIFKQSMGFALLLVAVWLVSTVSYAGWVMAYGVVLVLALWIWGSWVRFDAPLKRKVLVRGLAAALAVGCGVWMLRPPKGLAVSFEAFSQTRIDSALAGGRVVLVKFTAAWCLSCKVVDATVYDDPDVAAALADRGVVAVKGDVTDENLPAAKALRQLNKAIPLTVVYSSASPPALLEGKFSKADLMRVLDELAGEK